VARSNRAYLEVDDKGWDQVEGFVQRAAALPPVDVTITCRATTKVKREIPFGTVKGGKPVIEGVKRVIDKRSAGKNVTIWRTQAKKGRNPVHLDKSYSHAMIRAYMDGRAGYLKTGSATALQDAGNQIGELYIDRIRSNIDAGRSAGGKPMTPLKEGRHWPAKVLTTDRKFYSKLHRDSHRRNKPYTHSLWPAGAVIPAGYKKAYADHKRDRHGGKKLPILKDTGALYESFIYVVHVGRSVMEHSRMARLGGVRAGLF
jgi:hypothetical protein